MEKEKCCECEDCKCKDHDCDKECTHAKLGIVDQFQNKVISRKLLVFAVATGLLYLGVGLDADTWGMIAMAYIGGQTAIDFAKAWRHG